MSVDTVMSLTGEAILLALKLAGPFLVAGLVVGVVVSVLQAATQIQEMTLQFIPKIAVMVLVVVIAGPWMLAEITGYTTDLFKSIPQVVNGR